MRQEEPKPTNCAPEGGSHYAAAGVDADREQRAMRPFLDLIERTDRFRTGAGKPLLGLGHYANVLDLGGGMGLAIATDGVGTKILVAQMMGKFDTVGIDCVAMNVNDIICLGAEPLAMVDYIALECADEQLLEQLAVGLCRGAELAGISIPGGEVAQVAEMIRGPVPGQAFDLVGTAVGLVGLERLITGRDIRAGDVLIGLASSGIHSNGLTLARRALFEQAGYKPDTYLPEFGRRVGEELLEPTRIYVSLVRRLLQEQLPLRALAHISGDGLFNLTRFPASVGFVVEEWPAIPPVFQVIARAGQVPWAEMFKVFNMGIGFCLVVPPEPAVVEAVQAICASEGIASLALGRAVADPQGRIELRPYGLIGRNGTFAPDARRRER